MTDTTTLPPAFRGPSSDDREAWLEQRRTGITATEVRDLAKGSLAERRRILTEKITGERPFTGNRYTEHGNLREPIIAEWIRTQFDIPDNRHVWSRGRYLATPDGLDDEGLIFEIKTSKHDLDPGPVTGGILVMDRVTKAHRARHFWSTGYYDQMQWQMLVLDASECLFVWEQHDDEWPDPKPVYEVPRFCWIARDEARIAELVEIADGFLTELDAARYAGLPPVGEIEAETADHVQRLLLARNAEAIAKVQKDAEWRWLQARLLEAEGAGPLAISNEQAKVTVSVKTEVTEAEVVDEEAFEANERAQRILMDVDDLIKTRDRAQANLDKALADVAAIRADYTTRTSTSRDVKRLTVTAVKNKTIR